MKVIDSRPAPLAEVKEILKKCEKIYEKEGKELLHEQRLALEHARKFAKLSLKDTQELIQKLKEIELELTPEQIVKIADLLPKDVDTVRAIFAKERFKYTAEEIQSIIDIVDQYR